jgi:hypothetical protein
MSKLAKISINLLLLTFTFLLLPFNFSLVFAQAPDTLWTRTYGGTEYDEGHSLQETSDSGYIITGLTRSFIPGIYLIKTDVTGDTIWTKVYQTQLLSPGGWSVKQTYDGGYIVTGDNASDVWIIRTDSLGDTLWTRTYGAIGGDICHSITETSDSGFAFIWDRQTGGPFDIRLVKINTNGDFLWMKSCGRGYSFSLQQTTDGGYIISGQKNNGVYIIKTNSSGDTVWTKIYGGEFHCAWSVKQTYDGGYIVTGNKGNDIFLMKTDSVGDSLWTKTLGGDSIDVARSVWQISDGGYIITGSTKSFGAGGWDLYLIRTNNNGDTVWTKILGGAEADEGWQGQQTFDGKYIITGYTSSFGSGNADVWLLKVGTDIGIAEENTVVRKNNYDASIISGHLLLPQNENCKVFDITGREIHTLNPAPGIYFIQVDNEIVTKVVKIK